MTGPDNNYQQNPQQPYRDSGRAAGQYSTGGQYPANAQVPADTQHPAGGRYPTGAPHPSDGRPGAVYPAGGQFPSPGRSGPNPSGPYPTGQSPGPQSPGPQYPGGQYPGATPPTAAYRPGQEWDSAGRPQDPGPGGRPPSPLGFGVDQPAQPPSGSGHRADPAKLLGLAVALLGGLNFVFGFLPEVSAPRSGATLSVFAVGPAYVPILLLIAGLLALAAFLPGTERSRLAVAAVSVGGAAGAIVSLGTPGSFELFANPNQVSSGLGAILLVIFGIIQAVIAVGAYVVGADTLWKPKRGNGPSGAPPPAPNPVGWDATGSAGGPGPIDPSLVGRFTPERPRDVGGHPGPGAAPWPTDRVDVAQGWAGRGTSSGYPPAPTGMSPSWPAHPEEPETGPQMVVGLETGRVDTRKVAAVESTARDGAPPTAAATSVGDVVELAGEPADAAGSRDGDPGYPRDTAEPEPAHRQES